MSKKVNNWLSGIVTSEAKLRLWEVVNELKSIQEISGSSTFKFPVRLKQSTSANHILRGLKEKGIVVENPYDPDTITANKEFDELYFALKALINSNNKTEEHSNTTSSLPIKSSPSYNLITGKLSFVGKSIEIPLNTNQDTVCKVIFKNKTAMRKIWNWDEILEESGESNIENSMWRKVYDAGREIKNRVAIETGIKDLLTVKKSTTTVNPKYLYK